LFFHFLGCSLGGGLGGGVLRRLHSGLHRGLGSSSQSSVAAQTKNIPSEGDFEEKQLIGGKLAF